MPFLISPPLHSPYTSNPLYTYTIPTLYDYEQPIIRDLETWGWIVTWHREDDKEYIDALKEIDKAEKRRRRRTQMVFGEMVGEGPRLTLEEVWEAEGKRRCGRDRSVDGASEGIEGGNEVQGSMLANEDLNVQDG